MSEQAKCGWGAGCELPAGHIGMHAKGAPKPAQEPDITYGPFGSAHAPKEPSAEPCTHLSMIRDLPIRHCLICGPFEAVCSERDSLKAEVEFWHDTADDRSRHILAVEAERDALDHGHREFAKEITDLRATIERLESSPARRRRASEQAKD